MTENFSKISSNPSYITGADCNAMSALAGGDLTSMKNQRHIGEISESGGMAENLCDSANRRWVFYKTGTGADCCAMSALTGVGTLAKPIAAAYQHLK